MESLKHIPKLDMELSGSSKKLLKFVSRCPITIFLPFASLNALILIGMKGLTQQKLSGCITLKKYRSD